jgi:hypothetical protein
MDFITVAKKYINSKTSCLSLNDYGVFIRTLENSVEIAEPLSILHATSSDSIKFSQFLEKDLSRLDVIHEFLETKKNNVVFKELLRIYLKESCG